MKKKVEGLLSDSSEINTSHPHFLSLSLLQRIKNTLNSEKLGRVF